MIIYYNIVIAIRADQDHNYVMWDCWKTEWWLIASQVVLSIQ